MRVASKVCGEWAPNCFVSHKCSSSIRATISPDHTPQTPVNCLHIINYSPVNAPTHTHTHTPVNCPHMRNYFNCPHTRVHLSSIHTNIAVICLHTNAHTCQYKVLANFWYSSIIDSLERPLTITFGIHQ